MTKLATQSGGGRRGREGRRGVEVKKRKFRCTSVDNVGTSDSQDVLNDSLEEITYFILKTTRDGPRDITC